VSRPRNVIRSVSLHTHLPEDLYAKLTLHLYSPSEQRVPNSAYQRFICERITEFFNQRESSNDPQSRKPDLP
jgi:hypothetical protein